MPSKPPMSDQAVAKLEEITEKSLDAYFRSALRINLLDPNTHRFEFEFSLGTRRPGWKLATITLRYFHQSKRPLEVSRQRSLRINPIKEFLARASILSSEALDAFLTHKTLAALWRTLP